MCHPCPRTGVTLVSGPNTKEGSGEVLAGRNRPPCSPPLARGDESETTFMETALAAPQPDPWPEPRALARANIPNRERVVE